MKVNMFGLTLICLSLILTFQMSTEALIWNFDNKSEADDWVAIRGKWEIDTKEGVFIGTSDFDEGTAIVSKNAWDNKWVDYTLEVKVRNMGTENHFGIGFRDDGTGNHYGFYMNDFAGPKNGPIALVSDKNQKVAIAQFDYVRIEGEGIPAMDVSRLGKLTITWASIKSQ